MSYARHMHVSFQAKNQGCTTCRSICWNKKFADITKNVSDVNKFLQAVATNWLDHVKIFCGHVC